MTEPKFVWVVESTLSDFPRVEKYKYLETTPGGNLRVQVYERDKIIRKCAGRTFHFDEKKLWEYLARLARDVLATAKRKVKELEGTLAVPGGLEHYLRVELERMRDVPYGPPKPFKKE
jgi:hypothetical protein